MLNYLSFNSKKWYIHQLIQFLKLWQKSCGFSSFTRKFYRKDSTEIKERLCKLISREVTADFTWLLSNKSVYIGHIIEISVTYGVTNAQVTCYLLSHVEQTLSLEIKGHRLELTLSDLTYLVPGGGVILITV